MKQIGMGMLATFGFVATSLATPLYYWDFNNGSDPLQANIGTATASVFYANVGIGTPYLGAGTPLNAMNPEDSPNHSISAVSAPTLFQWDEIHFQNLNFTSISNVSLTFAARTFEILGTIDSFSVSYRIGSGEWLDPPIHLTSPTSSWSLYQVDFGDALDNQTGVTIRLSFVDGPAAIDLHQIDNVQIIPEPSAGALLAGGLILTGVVLRNRARSFRTLSRSAA